MKKPVRQPAKPPQQRRKRPRRGFGRMSLAVIVALFASSAAIRFGNGIGLAFAFGSDKPAETAQNCSNDPGTTALLSALQERERKITEREGILADRTQALNLADKRIQERLAALVAAEDELSRTVAIADRAATDDVTRLVTVYENMKPKQAAPLFAAMSADFAAGFLARMRPDAAAAVLANLDPNTAYSISAIMAGRNAGAPEN